MREYIITFVFCAVILGITGTTMIKQTIGLFRPEEEKSDVVLGHEMEQQKNGTSDKEEGYLGMIQSFTDNLVGKKEGAKAATEISNATSNNTYIESETVLLGKENWLFYKANNDGDPMSDYQGINHYSEEDMAIIAQKLLSDRDILSSYGIEFYMLSIPNKSNVYSEYMPDTIVRQDTTTKTDLFVDYLKKNTNLNVVYAKEALIKTKDAYQTYYKSDSHFNTIGNFVTVQLLKDAIDGNYDSLKNIKFNVITDSYSGDLAALCDMQDTFNDDIAYDVDRSTIDYSKKSDKRVLVIGDSFSEHMDPLMREYFADVYTVNIWSFSMDLVYDFQPDIIVWEHAERYTDRFGWVYLFE